MDSRLYSKIVLASKQNTRELAYRLIDVRGEASLTRESWLENFDHARFVIFLVDLPSHGQLLRGPREEGYD